jgi:hypothetical protein
VTLAEVPADPDMCVHLCPVADPGLLAAGVAALAEVVLDEVVDDACDARAADVELVEALAMVSPKASVAPSTAAPAAVPMRGLVILTRFSFRITLPGRRPGVALVSRQPPVGQAHLTGRCADRLSPR